MADRSGKKYPRMYFLGRDAAAIALPGAPDTLDGDSDMAEQKQTAWQEIE